MATVTVLKFSTPERAAAAMQHVKFELSATNLSGEQEQQLREAFGLQSLRAGGGRS